MKKRKKKEKTALQKSSVYKIVHNYIMFTVVGLCIIALVAGIISADINTSMLSIGRKDTMLALAHSEQQLELRVNEEKAAAIDLPQLENIDFYFGFSPIFWLAESFMRLFG